MVGRSPPTGGLQSPRVPQAIQDPALLQHPEADLSRGGEGPAGALEESEVGVSQIGRRASCSLLAPSSRPHLCGPFLSPRLSPCSLTPRLPELTTVISADATLPGTLLLDEVVAAGSQEQNLARLRHTQQLLSCHDPINIQFTSVGQRSPVLSPGWHTNACPSCGPPPRRRRQQRRSGESKHSSSGAGPSCLLCPGKLQHLVSTSHTHLPWPSCPQHRGRCTEPPQVRAPHLADRETEVQRGHVLVSPRVL